MRITTSRTPTDARWVVRAGTPVWVLFAVALALNGYVLVVEISKSDGFFIDQFFLPAICGLVAAGALAVGLSGLKIVGRTLVAIDVVTVTSVHPSRVADIDESNGLTVVTRDERRVQPYVCQRTWIQQVTRNRRLIVGAVLLRRWQSEWLTRTEGEAEPASGWRRRPRWTAILGVPGWAAFCGLVAVGLHAALH